MPAAPIKITFTLDEDDIAYFRKLHREAKKHAANVPPEQAIDQVRELVDRVRGKKRVPSFVREAVETLEQLIAMLEDGDYALPKKVQTQVVTALAYFANPEDLVPDTIPGLGFLDDAIMVKILEEEFRHELWGYQQFVRFRKGAEQRPWTKVAKDRLPRRLDERRKELRAAVEKRKAESSTKRRGLSFW